MPIPPLTDLYIDQSYVKLVQTENGEFADGLGNAITFGTTPTGSLLLTASAAGNTITFEKGDHTFFDITVAGGGAPGGTEQTIQFNSASVFSGSTDLKFDYANSNVLLTGSLLLTQSYISTVDYVDFSPGKYDTVTPGAIPPHVEGRLFYDTGSQTLCMFNNELDVTLNIGQESWLRARNQTGVTITNGSVVKINGAVGSRPSIALAQSTDQVQTFTEVNDIIGMATHDIEHGTDGFVTTFGLVNGLDTQGFTAGDLLWVSQSAGQYTNIAPSAPYDKMFVGVVTRVNPVNGSVFVTPQQPLHFHDISSVSQSGAYTQGDVWMFNQSASSGVWTNTKALSGSYSISGSLTVTGSTTLTGSLIVSGSSTFIGSQTITGSLRVTGSTIITGSLTASGSSHSLIGVVQVTGSLRVTGSITGSLFGTASWATNAITSVTSSYPIHVRMSGNDGTLYSVAPRAADTSISFNNNIFLGRDAASGIGSDTSPVSAIFLGSLAGFSASFANNSNFIGPAAGGFAFNANDSNFLGASAGNTAAYANNSNFIGNIAGRNASVAAYSNFIGAAAGETAYSASNSNFIGQNAGQDAAFASSSNFIGQYAGQLATSANNSNLFGYKAGYNKLAPSIGPNNIVIGTNISLSGSRRDSINIGGIIFGTGSYSTITDLTQDAFTGSAGGRIGINVVAPTRNFEVSGTVAFNSLTAVSYPNVVAFDSASGQLYYIPTSSIQGFPIAVTGSTLYSTSPLSVTAFGNTGNKTGSIYLGRLAGNQALSAADSVFIGSSAGINATNATKTVAIGSGSGAGTSFSANSVFIGTSAGFNASVASTSVFIGLNAGESATSAFNSNFIGELAGSNASSASGSTFIGFRAGDTATNAHSSFFAGHRAGARATSANNSIFIGTRAGVSGSGADSSVFIGFEAGRLATTAVNSNFIGSTAGAGATNAFGSNFLGQYTGVGASSAYYSNFLGTWAGWTSAGANNSNFLGYYAGYTAGNANNSNFIGQEAGKSATSAFNSNFLGQGAGQDAINADNSNFIGNAAGINCTNASGSNFIGRYAGRSADSGAFSNFIGYNAGYNAGAGSVGPNNIIIGTNITLGVGRRNSIDIGGIIFGTGSYSTTSGNPFSGSAGGRIGINVVTPTRNFEVSGSVALNSLTSVIQPTVVGIDTVTGQLYYQPANSGSGTTIVTQYTGSTVDAAAGTLNFTGSGVIVTGGAGTTTIEIGGSGGGTPGGADTNIQYNSASAFGGDNNFNYDYATQAVQLTGSLNIADTINYGITKIYAKKGSVNIGNEDDVAIFDPTLFKYCAIQYWLKEDSSDLSRSGNVMFNVPYNYSTMANEKFPIIDEATEYHGLDTLVTTENMYFYGFWDSGNAVIRVRLRNDNPYATLTYASQVTLI